MRKILLYITIFLYCTTCVFASGSIGVSVNQEQISFWDSLDIEVRIEFNDAQWPEDITISGIENFNVFSSMQQESMQVYGQDIQRTQTIFLQVEPKSEGVFQIWPVIWTFSWETVSSNTVEVTVGDLVILETERDQIQGLRQLSKNIFIFIVISVLMLCIFYYSIYTILFPKKKQIQKTHKKTEESPSYIDQLTVLWKHSITMTKQEFYEELHSIVRLYIQNTYNVPDVDSLTLRELQPFLKQDKKIMWIFSESYMMEFNNDEDTVEQRRKFITEYKKLL